MPDLDGNWVGTANHPEVYADMEAMGMKFDASVSGLDKTGPGLNNNGGPTLEI
ncbi:MAG: hypothetical protein AAGB32_04825 [Pseudomonadota bacterium]